jgi:hypothetical protein
MFVGTDKPMAGANRPVTWKGKQVDLYMKIEMTKTMVQVRVQAWIQWQEGELYFAPMRVIGPESVEAPLVRHRFQQVCVTGQDEPQGNVKMVRLNPTYLVQYIDMILRNCVVRVGLQRTLLLPKRKL